MKLKPWFTLETEAALLDQEAAASALLHRTKVSSAKVLRAAIEGKTTPISQETAEAAKKMRMAVVAMLLQTAKKKKKAKPLLRFAQAVAQARACTSASPIRVARKACG